MVDTMLRPHDPITFVSAIKQPTWTYRAEEKAQYAIDALHVHYDRFCLAWATLHHHRRLNAIQPVDAFADWEAEIRYERRCLAAWIEIISSRDEFDDSPLVDLFTCCGYCGYLVYRVCMGQWVPVDAKHAFDCAFKTGLSRGILMEGEERSIAYIRALVKHCKQSNARL